MFGNKTMETYMIIQNIDSMYRGFVSPIVAFIGIFGNLMIMCVLLRGTIRRFEWYCLILSVTNLCAVVFNTVVDDFLGRGMKYLTNNRWSFTPSLYSSAACQTLELLPKMMYFCSAYIFVIFTLDRCLVMTWPFKFRPDSHLRETICVTSAVIVLGFIVSLPIGLSHELYVPVNVTGDGGVTKECQVSKSQLSVVGLYLMSVGTFVVPTLLIAVLNALILRQLHRMQHYRGHVGQAAVSEPEMHRIYGHISLSAAFLVLTIPLSVVIILRLSSGNGDRISNNPRTTLAQLSKLFSSIKDLSYICNIFLYTIFLPKFRRQLRALISCRFQKINSTQSRCYSDSNALRFPSSHTRTAKLPLKDNIVT